MHNFLWKYLTFITRPYTLYWTAAAVVVSSVVASKSASKTRGAAGQAARRQERTAREAQELNIERYGEARELLDPYISEARTAREQQMIEMGLAPGEAGTAYMETPGYQALLEERRGEAQQAAASSGSLYSGRRIQAAADVGGATQSQFYTNYMNMLQNLGSPGVATNLASLGVGQAATIGQQNLAAQQVAGQYRVAGAQAQQAATADIIGGAANIYGSYLSSQRPATPPPLGAPPPTAAYGDAYQPAQQYGGVV